MPRPAPRHAGLLIALLLSAAAAGHQLGRQRVGYTRYDLPSYDAYVYMTMADEPAFFTSAPWGYRVLPPRLVHLFRPRDRLVAFRDLCYWSLVGCGGLLFLFLRRLGHGPLMALLGVIVFQLSRPVSLALGNPVLGEPLGVLLEIGVLLAVAGRAATPVVAALLATGALAKELFLVMPPLLFLARVQRDGARRALRAALLAAAPAFSVLLLLRLWWTPGLLTPRAPFDLALLRAGLEALGLDWFDTGRALLLSGVMPLALAGAPLREARPFLRVYGYLALLFVALSVAAWVNVPSPTPVPLFGANTERLLIYALPLLIPLALLALERVLRLAPAVAPPPASGAEPSWLRAASVAACAAALLLPLLASQRYRRLPLHASRDGPLLMAFCRESLRTARQLERGEEVAFDPERMRFAWGIDDPGRLFEMRWFLREGWGPLAHYGIHDVVMREPRATLALPCLNPRALLVSLALQAEQPASFRVFVNGAAVGRVGASPEGAPASLLVPAGALVRGDNLLTLAALDGAPLGTRLRGLTLRAAR